MSVNLQKLKAVFYDALENQPPERWEAHLESACAGDPELLREARALLEAHVRQDSLLDGAPVPRDWTEPADDLPERPGYKIGPYTLREQIGEGGFGMVFLAEQTQPVRRKVALKVIKPGMDTRQVIARFEAERQALALMDHPHIAKVLDAGATDSGRPYFVMELVRGVPITEYCDQCTFTTRERLALFISICHAVQHAHQKGVIHRDLKPTNVMVAMLDGHPTPKIIDFGVAKAMGARLTERTLVTGFAQMLGTPMYMSPEQAELSPLGVDTQSDIYSLGVLLYELLTGTTPFVKERLREAGFDELRRIIREEVPPRPSARLSTLAADLDTTIAERHRVDRQKLVQTLRGDLDWIVMKCLEKDRSRRYETVNSFVEDLEHYLNEQPVKARPPSAIYGLRKFARRNKATICVALGVALILLGGIVTTSWQAIRATRAEHIARRRLARAVEAETRARAQAKQARIEADRTNAVVTLLQEMLGAAHPDASKGTDFTVRELLDEFSAQLDDQLRDEPRVEATLRHLIGSIYTRIHLLDEAEPHLQRALELWREVPGDQHRKIAESLGQLAWNTLARGKHLEGEKLAREALEVSRNRSDLSGRISRLWILENALMRQNQLDEAERIANQALSLARQSHHEDHPDLPNILHGLADAKFRMGEYKEGERLARKAVKKHVQVHGESHPETAWGWFALGRALKGQREYSEAEQCFRRSSEIFYEHFPRGHHFFDLTSRELIEVLHRLDKHSELADLPSQYPGVVELEIVRAETYAQRSRNFGTAMAAINKAVERYPENHRLKQCRGTLYARCGRWREAVSDYQATTMSDGPRVLMKYACLLLLTDRTDDYQTLCRRMFDQSPKDQDVEVLSRYAKVGALHPTSPVDPERLLEWAERAASLRRGSYTLSALAWANYRSGRFDQTVRILKELMNRGSIHKSNAAFPLALAYHGLGDTRKSREWYELGRKALDRVTPRNPDDMVDWAPPHWMSVNVWYPEAKAALESRSPLGTPQPARKRPAVEVVPPALSPGDERQ